MKDFVIELEQNAKDSLIHGIVHYQDDLVFQKAEEPSRFHLKFTILSVFHSIELFLKARLVKAHPILIYEKPEEIGHRGKTVSFDALLKRLTNVGVDLKKDEENLKKLQAIRNKIEHHRIEMSLASIEDYIVKAIRFLEKFLNNELQINLKELLDETNEDIYKDIAHCLDSYDARLIIAVNKAKSYASQEQDYKVISCDHCRQQTMVLPNPVTEDGNAYCLLCEWEWFIFFCEKCNAPFYFSPDEPHEHISIIACQDCEGWTAHNFDKY